MQSHHDSKVGRRVGPLRAVLGVCVAIVSLAVALGSAPGASGAAGGACQMAGLKVSVGSANGAAGHIDYVMKFKNISGHQCTLRGYPAVAALNRAGKRLGSPAGHATVNKVRSVTVGAGGVASARFSVVEAGNYPRSTCGKIANAVRLRITLHGVRTIPFSFKACSKAGPRYMSVGAVY